MLHESGELSSGGLACFLVMHRRDFLSLTASLEGDGPGRRVGRGFSRAGL